MPFRRRAAALADLETSRAVFAAVVSAAVAVKFRIILVLDAVKVAELAPSTAAVAAEMVASTAFLAHVTAWDAHLEYMVATATAGLASELWLPESDMVAARGIKGLLMLQPDAELQTACPCVLLREEMAVS